VSTLNARLTALVLNGRHGMIRGMLPGLSDPFWVGLLAKMLATAAIVVAVPGLVERAGSFPGAMIATLPVPHDGWTR
jgi:hypothetical protein